MRKCVSCISVLGKKVLVTKRACFKDTDLCAKQNYAGGFQIAPHGGVEKDETYENAMRRELKEELGSSFSDFIDEEVRAGRISIELARDNKDKNMRTYVIIWNEDNDNHKNLLSKIDLIGEHSDLEWIEIDRIMNMKNLSEFKAGVPDGVDAIFHDEVETLRGLKI